MSFSIPYNGEQYKIYKYYAVDKSNGCTKLIQGFDDYRECEFYCKNNKLDMIEYGDIRTNLRIL